MNKHVKLIKYRTISEYTCNFDKSDFSVLFGHKVGLSEYLKDNLNDEVDCFFDFTHYVIDIQFDSDLDCTKFLEKIEKSIGEYFRLALTESDY